MIAIILILIVIVIIAALCKDTSPSNCNTISNNHDDISSMTNSSSNKITISSGVSVILPGDTRYIDGIPIKTPDEYERWKVLLGFSKSFESHLGELESQFTNKKDFNASEHYKEWQEYYQKYRQLILRHYMYNGVIGLLEPFKATESQALHEKKYLDDLQKRYQNAEIERELYIDELYLQSIEEGNIINFLMKCPYKKSYKAEMIKTISQNDSEQSKVLQKAYNRLKSKEIIGENKSENGKIMTRIIVRRKKSNVEIKAEQLSLSHSIYKEELYEKVDTRTIYKAELTVGQPINLDRVKNICSFISLSSGSEYYTSLEKCTCHSFDGKYPCKHMVKLAMHLGYYEK